MVIRRYPPQASPPSIAAIGEAIPRPGTKDVHALPDPARWTRFSPDRRRCSHFDCALLADRSRLPLSLLLSIAGIYGVMSSLVSQSTHEVGLRMALGACPKDACSPECSRSALAAASLVGVLGGVAATLALTGVLQRFVFRDRRTHDPAAFASRRPAPRRP